jgi:gas vesicle protein
MSDNRSPEEIERDIERERSELSGTIHDLQDRFSLDGAVRQVSDHLRDNGGEIARNISHTVKQNPLGVALVGAGLAWLAFGQRQNTVEVDRRVAVDRREPVGTPSEPNRGFVRDEHTGRRTFGEPVSYPVGSNDRHAGAMDYSRSRYMDDDPEMDWLYDDLDDDYHSESLGDRAGAWAGKARDAGSSAAGSVKDAADSTAEGAKSAASSVAGGAKSAAGSASAGAKSAAGSVRDAGAATASGISSAAGSARDRAAHAAQSAQDAAARARVRLSQGTERLSEEARERVIQARQAAVRARARAEAATRSARDQSAEMYDRQPLAFGALAFAIGAAAAATLPRTRQEDELLGDQSDRLIRRAQRIFEEEKRKVGDVAEAVRDEAKDIAEETRQGIDESAPGEKSAVEAAADHAKDSAKRVADKAKSEADKKNVGKPSSK